MAGHEREEKRVPPGTVLGEVDYTGGSFDLTGVWINQGFFGLRQCSLRGIGVSIVASLTISLGSADFTQPADRGHDS
jgi:hypothetical protein